MGEDDEIVGTVDGLAEATQHLAKSGHAMTREDDDAGAVHAQRLTRPVPP